MPAIASPADDYPRRIIPIGTKIHGRMRAGASLFRTAPTKPRDFGARVRRLEALIEIAKAEERASRVMLRG